MTINTHQPLDSLIDENDTGLDAQTLVSPPSNDDHSNKVNPPSEKKDHVSQLGYAKSNPWTKEEVNDHPL